MIPIISGTVAGQTVDQGSTINPFTNTTVTDGNDYISDTTLTITLLDANGNPTDANGQLGGSDPSGVTSFSEQSPGVYVLVDHSAPSPTRNLEHFQSLLPNLTFIPATAATTNFVLTTTDTYNERQTDSTTTVQATGGTSAAAQPQTVPQVSTTTDTPASTVTDTPASTVTDTPASTTTDTSASATTDTQTTPQTTPQDTSPNIHETGRVGANQTDVLTQGDGHLVIDHPRAFHGTVNLTSGDIDLNGLVQADSYSFKDDVLSIYGGGKTLDKLKLTGGSDFSVEKTAAGVSIYTTGDTLHSVGTMLPLHT